MTDIISTSKVIQDTGYGIESTRALSTPAAQYRGPAPPPLLLLLLLLIAVVLE